MSRFRSNNRKTRIDKIEDRILTLEDIVNKRPDRPFSECDKIGWLVDILERNSKHILDNSRFKLLLQPPVPTILKLVTMCYRIDDTDLLRNIIRKADQRIVMAGGYDDPYFVVKNMDRQEMYRSAISHNLVYEILFETLGLTKNDLRLISAESLVGEVPLGNRDNIKLYSYFKLRDALCSRKGRR